jgi:hypothetical protein
MYMAHGAEDFVDSTCSTPFGMLRNPKHLPTVSRVLRGLNSVEASK